MITMFWFILDLAFWKTHTNFIEVLTGRDLAAESTIWQLLVCGALQHFFFIFTDLRELAVDLFHINVTGRAHGLAATFAYDPIDAIEDSGAHDALVVFGLDDPFRCIGINVYDL